MVVGPASTFRTTAESTRIYGSQPGQRSAPETCSTVLLERPPLFTWLSQQKRKKKKKGPQTASRECKHCCKPLCRPVRPPGLEIGMLQQKDPQRKRKEHSSTRGPRPLMSQYILSTAGRSGRATRDESDEPTIWGHQITQCAPVRAPVRQPCSSTDEVPSPWGCWRCWR